MYKRTVTLLSLITLLTLSLSSCKNRHKTSQDTEKEPTTQDTSGDNTPSNPTTDDGTTDDQDDTQQDEDESLSLDQLRDKAKEEINNYASDSIQNFKNNVADTDLDDILNQARSSLENATSKEDVKNIEAQYKTDVDNRLSIETNLKTQSEWIRDYNNLLTGTYFIGSEVDSTTYLMSQNMTDNERLISNLYSTSLYMYDHTFQVMVTNDKVVIENTSNTQYLNRNGDSSKVKYTGVKQELTLTNDPSKNLIDARIDPTKNTALRMQKGSPDMFGYYATTNNSAYGLMFYPISVVDRDQQEFQNKIALKEEGTKIYNDYFSKKAIITNNPTLLSQYESLLNQFDSDLKDDSKTASDLKTIIEQFIADAEEILSNFDPDEIYEKLPDPTTVSWITTTNDLLNSGSGTYILASDIADASNNTTTYLMNHTLDSGKLENTVYDNLKVVKKRTTFKLLLNGFDKSTTIQNVGDTDLSNTGNDKYLGYESNSSNNVEYSDDITPWSLQDHSSNAIMFTNDAHTLNFSSRTLKFGAYTNNQGSYIKLYKLDDASQSEKDQQLLNEKASAREYVSSYKDKSELSDEQISQVDAFISNANTLIDNSTSLDEIKAAVESYKSNVSNINPPVVPSLNNITFSLSTLTSSQASSGINVSSKTYSDVIHVQSSQTEAYSSASMTNCYIGFGSENLNLLRIGTNKNRGSLSFTLNTSISKVSVIGGKNSTKSGTFSINTLTDEFTNSLTSGAAISDDQFVKKDFNISLASGSTLTISDTGVTIILKEIILYA